tara:strand:- start:1159 stop:2559 length:1401 start_codon:yes stop_codon:yes gene_type:complete
MSKSEIKLPIFNDEELAKELNIDQVAVQDAGQDLPESNSQDLSSLERKIQARISHFYKSSIEKCGDEILEQRIGNTRALRQQNGHAGQISTRKQQLEAVYAKDKEKIKNLHEKHTKNKSNLSFFKKDHNLISPANLKSQSAKIISILIVFGMFIFEISVNTSFLAPAVEGGIIGGLALASVVSFINIVTSFLVGRFVITNLSHKKRSKNNVSSLVLLIYVPLVIYINFAIGVFRSLSQKAVETFSTDALRAAAEQAAWPFAYISENTIESTGLIIIGLLFAVIAILDGYFFDEPYPGYAKITRDADKSSKDFENAKSLCFDTLYELQEAGNQQFLKLKEARINANIEWGNAIDAVQRAFKDYEEWVKDLNKSGNILLNQYRSKNKSFRASQAPQYFDEEFDFEFEQNPRNRFFSLSSENLDDTEKRNIMDKTEKLITDEYIEATKEINNFYDDILQDYQNLIERLN